MKKLRFLVPSFSSLIAVLFYFSAPLLAQQSGLIEASSAGDVARVRQLIGAGDNVNSKSKDGTTALIAAAEKGHLDVVLALLSAKADVNAKAVDVVFKGVVVSKGQTALLAAARGYNSNIVKALLDARADINATDSAGQTALMVTRDVEVAKLLLGAGVDVNARDKFGQTALFHARGREQLEEFLSDRLPKDPFNRSCSATIQVALRDHAPAKLELRQGRPGASKIIQSTNGGVGRFEKLCYGSYFIAIGDGETVEITPIIDLLIGQQYNGIIETKAGKGNLRDSSRSGL